MGSESLTYFAKTTKRYKQSVSEELYVKQCDLCCQIVSTVWVECKKKSRNECKQMTAVVLVM